METPTQATPTPHELTQGASKLLHGKKFSSAHYAFWTSMTRYFINFYFLTHSIQNVFLIPAKNICLLKPSFVVLVPVFTAGLPQNLMGKV
jgi:hypothetical protein